MGFSRWPDQVAGGRPVAKTLLARSRRD